MKPPHLILGALALCLVGCAQQEEQRGEDSVAVVARQPVMLPERMEVQAVGSARAAVSADLYPETAGVVNAVRFAPGDFVAKGQVLVELDARRERLAVELAEVRVQEAAQLLARYRRIEDSGAISDSQIEAGETALASARVELQQAQTTLADRTLRAPFAGHIGLTSIDRGDRVGTTTAIAQLDQRGTLFVDFPAPEAAFSRLASGSTVTMVPFADPDRSIEAKVVAVDSSIAAEQRTFVVRTAIDNRDDTLRPGMSFRISFTDEGVMRPAVPEEAVMWGGDGSYLWAVRDNKAQRVPATVTSRRDGLALVEARLAANDLVIVEGVQKVRDGQVVRLVKPRGPSSQDVQVGSAAAEPSPSPVPSS